MEGWVDLGYPSVHRPGVDSRSPDHEYDALTTTPPSQLTIMMMKKQIQ